MSNNYSTSANKSTNKSTTSDLNLSELNDFELSDTESDSDDEVELNQSNINLLNNLELRYFPEPYNSIGQFLVSAIIGVCSSFLMRTKDNLVKDNNEIFTCFDTYINYCKNVKNDEYINQIYKVLKLDPDTEDDQHKMEIIFNNIKQYANQLLVELIKTDILNNTKYTNQIDNTNMEQFNQDLTNDIIPLIKFSQMVKIFNKTS